MRARLIAPLFSLAFASVANAHVIEIADDGEVFVLSVSAAPTSNRGQLPKFDQLPAISNEAAANDPFERASRRHGVDVNLLRAVAWTESRGRGDAVSPKGALGIMQLMPATAAELGVDPRDPVANIDGGAAYLARQLATFHDVPLALAAYNAGPGAVMRYRGVPPYAETRDYVSKVMGRWQGPGAVAAWTASTTAAPPFTGGAAALPAPTQPVKSLAIMLIEVPN